MDLELDQFRDVDLVIDRANDSFVQKQFVSQGDYNGRSLTVQVTNNGSVGTFDGLSMNLYWHNKASGLTDLSAFVEIDKSNSVFRIYYPDNMMTPGEVIANIQIVQDGKTTFLKSFTISVQYLAGKPTGITQNAEFTALVAVLADSNKFRTDINSLDRNKADRLELQSEISNINQNISSISKGNPSGVFATLAALKSAFPNGNQNIYVVTADGKWYYWSGNDWISGGIYQGEIANAENVEITNKKDIYTTDNVEDALNEIGERFGNFADVNAENIFENSDFIDTSYWQFASGLVYSVSNNELSITFLNSSAAKVYKTLPLVSGRKYYLSEMMLSNSAANGMYVMTSEGQRIIPHSGSNTFERLSTVFEASSTSTGIRLLNTGLAGDISSNPIKIKQAMLIDLTKTYGLGKEPTKEEFEKILNIAFPETMFFIGKKYPMISYTEGFNYLLDKIENPLPVTPKKWAAMGDSITEGASEYPDYANKILNWQLTNLGVGGSAMAVRGADFASFDENSFVRLAARTDFTAYDYVTLCIGTNDWSSSVPLGTNTDTLETTFKGAFELGLRSIFASNPSIKIVVMTSPYRQNAQWRTNSLGLYLTDYTKAIQEVCDIWSLRCIDFYHTSGINYLTWTTLTKDGLHPNLLGAERLGNILAGVLKYT